MVDRPDELCAVDLVWNVEAKEIAVNRIWLQHVHHAPNGFSWGDALQTIADKFVSSLGDGSKGGAIFPFISNQITLTRVDAYQIPTSGDATDKRTSTPSSTLGGSATGDYSPIMGAVVQLWGYNPTGFVQHARRHRGRLFVVGTPMAYFADIGRLQSSNADSIASAWGSFLNDIQGMHVSGESTVPEGPDTMNVGVYSRTAGAFYQLEAVTCAYKPGIQHSRMNKLVGSRSAAAAIDHG